MKNNVNESYRFILIILKEMNLVRMVDFLNEELSDGICTFVYLIDIGLKDSLQKLISRILKHENIQY
jgi:hypothetical protein